MLSIFYGDGMETIYNPALFFKNSYEDAWITNPLSQDMILDVDKSRVIGPRIIDSPVLGAITPRELSGGVKTLICMYKRPDLVFNASACGDNCAKWILKISEEQDITINLFHLMNFDEGPFQIRVLNADQIAHNGKELFYLASRYTG